MLAVFYGNDTTKVREAAQAWVSNQGFVVERIDDARYTPGIVREAAGAASLFGETSVYILDTPSRLLDFSNEVLAALPELASSPTVFVVIEDNLLAPEKKKYQKHASTLEEYKKPADARFNTFAFADALSKKDKRQLWVLYQEAQAAGISPEKIAGVLWWQLKTLQLATVSASPQEAGVKDFPYNKAKRALSNFGPGELGQLTTSLLRVYHEGHGTGAPLVLGLERWLLELR